MNIFHVESRKNLYKYLNFQVECMFYVPVLQVLILKLKTSCPLHYSCTFTLSHTHTYSFPLPVTSTPLNQQQQMNSSEQIKSKDHVLLSFLHRSQWIGSQQGGTRHPSVIPAALSQSDTLLVTASVILHRHEGRV